MTDTYSRRFWRKMKAVSFAFGTRQALVLLAVIAVFAVQFHYGTASNGVKRVVIIAAPYVLLLLVYFLIQAWHVAKLLDNDLMAELEAVTSQSGEIYADLILAWLNESLERKGRFTSKQVAEETGLSEQNALQGLTLLGNKYGVVRETLLSGAWEYSAVGPALRLKSRFKPVRS